MEIGPVDYMIVAFPGSKFQGEITPALGKLVDSGTIRIIERIRRRTRDAIGS